MKIQGLQQINIAILASGTGSNATALIKHFKASSLAQVSLVVSNRENALVLEKAKDLDVATALIKKQALYESNDLLEVFTKHNIQFVLLAGFLLKIPTAVVREYQGKILNIHPALLPKFGGKGMYGQHVHKAVLEQGEKESGITIHEVNEVYDDGKIIQQASCIIEEGETPESLQQKVHALEHAYFGKVAEQYIKETFKL